MSIHFSRKTALLVSSSLQKTGFSGRREFCPIAQDGGEFINAGLCRSQWVPQEETEGSTGGAGTGARKAMQPPMPHGGGSGEHSKCLSLRAADRTSVCLVGPTTFRDSICQGDQRPNNTIFRVMQSYPNVRTDQKFTSRGPILCPTKTPESL